MISKKQFDSFTYLVDNNDKFAASAFEFYLGNEDLEELLQNLSIVQAKSSISVASSDLVKRLLLDSILGLGRESTDANNGIRQTVLPFSGY